MGDHHDGSALSPRGQILEDLHFGFRVQRGGGLIQDENRGVLDHRASDRQPLSLARGELAAALAKLAMVSALLLLNELVRARHLGRRLDCFIAGVRDRVADVLGDGRAKQQVLLQGYRNVAAQALDLELSQIGSADLDTSLVGVK